MNAVLQISGFNHALQSFFAKASIYGHEKSYIFLAQRPQFAGMYQRTWIFNNEMELTTVFNLILQRKIL